MINNPYKDIVLKSVPRLLSLLNRNSLSEEFGCFDRKFWHYKTISDSPQPAMQSAVLALALLYKNSFESNVYYQNQQIIQYVSGALRYWCRLVHKNGSLDEWFLNERSFVATAFSAYAVSEAFLLLKNEVNKTNIVTLTSALTKAGNYLAKTNNPLALNQTSGAALALYNIYLVTGDEFYKSESAKKIKILLNSQNLEGWFPEYGGADIGYLSVAIDYLAKYYKKSGDSLVKEPLERAVSFLSNFIHPDGSSGGSYTSRNTQYLLPHGLEILAKNNDLAVSVLGLFYRGIGNDAIVTPLIADDYYFTFFFISNYVDAMFEFQKVYPVQLNKKSVLFNESSLYSINTEGYFAFFSAFKNGAIKIYSPEGKILYNQAGYFARLNNSNKIFSTQIFDSTNKFKIIKNSDNNYQIEIESSFRMVNENNTLKNNYLFFKVFSYTFLKIDFIARIFGKFVKKYKISHNSKTSLTLKRIISIDSQKIEISDLISNPLKLKFKEFKILEDVTLMHVPSSKYFTNSQIKYFFSEDLNSELRNKVNQEGKALIRVLLNRNPEQLFIKIE